MALVIGNGAYRSTSLKAPVNDARAMAEMLKGLGFTVAERSNLDHESFVAALDTFGARLRPGMVAVFYFSGQGLQLQGKNYLLPVDIKPGMEEEVRRRAVDVARVVTAMEQAGVGAAIVILDASRDNQLSRAFHASGRGLAFIPPPAGTLIGFATSPGKTVPDGNHQISPYTAALVTLLGTPGVGINELFHRVTLAFTKQTITAQNPWHASSLRDDFVLAPATAVSAVTLAGGESPAATPVQPMPKGFVDTVTGMSFVPVPGGCFPMGDTFGDGYDDELPVHRVCLDGFMIGRYEVTQGEWVKVMGSNPATLAACGASCPVDSVSWHDAQAFIKKLNKLSGKTYRLPTEAEWEYAARSGGKKEKYAGSDLLEAVGWYEANSGATTHPVGRKAPNGLGIYDMSGNVREWVQDWKADFTEKDVRNPRGPSSGETRLIRGGCWSDYPVYLRATQRDSYDPYGRDSNHGFRLAISP
jgi:formylglycine-generating enzyme required for sulfatase activity